MCVCVCDCVCVCVRNFENLLPRPDEACEVFGRAIALHCSRTSARNPSGTRFAGAIIGDIMPILGDTVGDGPECGLRGGLCDGLRCGLKAPRAPQGLRVALATGLWNAPGTSSASSLPTLEPLPGPHGLWSYSFRSDSQSICRGVMVSLSSPCCSWGEGMRPPAALGEEQADISERVAPLSFGSCNSEPRDRQQGGGMVGCVAKCFLEAPRALSLAARAGGAGAHLEGAGGGPEAGARPR
jgi:hypothetical protein